MIDKNVFKYINKVLDELEDEFNIEILFAVESGSRAWGFSNKYSDYDIRFVYKKPLKEYLTIHPKREVINDHDLKGRVYDYPLDFEGWDIRKALALHYKDNPNLREWINSPIVYRGDGDAVFYGLPDFSKITLCNHYSSMAYNTAKKYLLGDAVNDKYIKKQLYVIRCILTLILINQYDVYPPINIYDLLEHPSIKKDVPVEVIENIYILLSYYRNGCDGDFPSSAAKFLHHQFIIPYTQNSEIRFGNGGKCGEDYLTYDECLRGLLL